MGWKKYFFSEFCITGGFVPHDKNIPIEIHGYKMYPYFYWKELWRHIKRNYIPSFERSLKGCKIRIGDKFFCFFWEPYAPYYIEAIIRHELSYSKLPYLTPYIDKITAKQWSVCHASLEEANQFIKDNPEYLWRTVERKSKKFQFFSFSLNEPLPEKKPTHTISYVKKNT